MRTNNKLNPHVASTPKFEPGQNWWEASALIMHCTTLAFPKEDQSTIGDKMS